MKIKFVYLALLTFGCTYSFGQSKKSTIEGEMKVWHKVTIHFTGDDLAEHDADNPFLNYRLNVTFKKGDQSIIIPGFYAADGNASESSASKGRIWQVRFCPNQPGEWSYKASFRKGKNIAINEDINAGSPISFDGENGTFSIMAIDPNDDDHRRKGRLQYVGDRYLRYTDTQKPFLKAGTDSPENFLGYYEFDQTPPSHKYQPHAEDWKSGDPTWQNGKGKNIIGALNYLASKGMNSVYFLTMNVQGDGKDVWPWTDENERYRFDCSKLDQWEIVFDHMDALGIMLHVVTQETENELLLDIGQLGVQRKLYYRELIARFSHHLAITWNLGEENGPVHWSPKGQNDDDRKAMAKYIKETDPYKNLVVLHTHAVPESQEVMLNPLIDFPYLDGPSIQIHKIELAHAATKKWIYESRKSEKVWVVNQDEIGPASTGAKPDNDDPTHDDIRAQVLWGNLMAGGAGVEWYFGYQFAHHDLTCEDWRSRNNLWDQTKYAVDFFHNYLPFTEMHSADDLTDNSNDYVFVKNGDIYAIYLPDVTETKIDLTGYDKSFEIRWYNPRTGSNLMIGSLNETLGGDVTTIGFPPERSGDWVALLTKVERKPKPPKTSKIEVVKLDAIRDFKIDESSAAVYYKDNANGAFAINAAQINQRNKFATASSIFKGSTGVYKASFISMAENDGESEYVIRINGTVIDTLVNPKTSATFNSVRQGIGTLFLHHKDLIQVSSKAVTNGKIPEGNETAWSRGRWNGFEFIPNGLTLAEKLKEKKSFEEKNGFLEVEAEAFHHHSNNGTKRDWYIRSKNSEVLFPKLTDHFSNASGGAYIESLPDTRVTHDDPLLAGENFFPVPGIGGTVSYKVNISTPGKYYIWAQAFSSGTEDNGVHVGIDGDWPESGARIQWCEGKEHWTWSSAQRIPENHCGNPNSIYLNIQETGTHIISFSMREDGFEMDKWLMTTNPDYIPK